MFWISTFIIQLPLGVGEIFCLVFQTHKGHWGMMVCVYYASMCICVCVCVCVWKGMLAILSCKLEVHTAGAQPKCHLLLSENGWPTEIEHEAGVMIFLTAQASQKECNICSNNRWALLGLFWELGGVGRGGKKKFISIIVLWLFECFFLKNCRFQFYKNY